MNGSHAGIGELLAGLERDASELREELARLAAASQKAEADAMAAIQGGNDALARECLMRQDRLFESAAAVEKQLSAQQAFIATCRELLASVDQPAAASAPVPSTEPDGDPLLKRVAEIQQEISAAFPPDEQES